MVDWSLAGLGLYLCLPGVARGISVDRQGPGSTCSASHCRREGDAAWSERRCAPQPSLLGNPSHLQSLHLHLLTELSLQVVNNFTANTVQSRCCPRRCAPHRAACFRAMPHLLLHVRDRRLLDCVRAGRVLTVTGSSKARNDVCRAMSAGRGTRQAQLWQDRQHTLLAPAARCHL